MATITLASFQYYFKFVMIIPPPYSDSNGMPVENILTYGDRIHKIARKWKDQIPEIVTSSSVAAMPNTDKPFVFFHQRKTGGSTFRHHLFRVARIMRVPPFIPSCRFGKIPCEVDSVPKHKRFAVYGGHFRYTDLKKRFSLFDLTNAIHDKKPQNSDPFSCMVTIRPTVDRVISCWNYRFAQELNLTHAVPTAANMKPSDWDTLLPVSYSKFHEGCNNEFVRNFGDLHDEYLTNTMSIRKEDEVENLLALRELDVVLSRLSRCVITTLSRCHESMLVIDHYLPWLNKNIKYDCNQKVNEGKINNEQKLINPGAEKAILSHNLIDQVVYEFAELLFEEQLRVAKESKQSA